MAGPGPTLQVALLEQEINNICIPPKSRLDLSWF